MNNLLVRFFYFSFCVLLCNGTSRTFAQTNTEVFGQNRVQYRKFDWKYFDTKHFRVYHYDKAGRELGRYVAEEAEYDISVIEKKLGGQFPQRFNIILYNSYDEYNQTNVGLKTENPAMGNTRSGSLKLVDDKLVVYFTGAHRDLRRQIRSGMATVVMQRVLYGENIKSKIKNSLLLNLPAWVTEGYIAYLVDGWDEKSNSEWKSILDANPKMGFYELSELHPEIAGKAFWKFIASQYGTNMEKSLLFSIQQKTSLNKAMKDPMNLNMKVTKAYDSCINFYKEAYKTDAINQEKPDSTGGIITLKVPKDYSTITNIKVSPSGKEIAYVRWKGGRFTVYTQQTKGNQTLTPLLEGGVKDLTELQDPNYPMLTWSNTGSKLAILYRKGKETRLDILNNTKGRRQHYNIPPNRFDRVLSMAFLGDDNSLVFSAIRKSQTDLYQFTIKGSKMTNITDDVWDDLTPQFISEASFTGIVFSSNRPKPNLIVPQEVNELPAGPQNIFFYNTNSKNKELLQLTHVANGHITQPIQHGKDNFAYLHDSNGINNKFVVLFGRNAANKDSAYSLPITNYNSNIISHQYNHTTGDVSEVIQVGNKYKVYFHEPIIPNDTTTPKTLVPTILSERVDDEMMLPQIASPTNPLGLRYNSTEERGTSTRGIPATKSSIKSGKVFQSEFSDDDNQTPTDFGTAPDGSVADFLTEDDNNSNSIPDSSMLVEITDSAYLKMKPSPYKKSFKPDFVSVKLDNSILFNQYQIIAANGGNYTPQGISGLTNITLDELLENQRLTGGFQFPMENNTSTYFLQYQNFTKRLDWGVFYMRKQYKELSDILASDGRGNIYVIPDRLFKVNTNMVQGDLSYPIDRRRSLRFHTALREDRYTPLTIDTISLLLNFGKTVTYSSFSKLEYVFDNTISPTTNILFGTRYKLYTEYIRTLSEPGKYAYTFGFDVRNYEKIYKNFIFATRLSYAHSDGTSKVQYLLGGVDNWIRPSRDAAGSQPPGSDYGYQLLATSLRGYRQFARSGNNYASFSNELRLPVITTFVKRPVKSSILKNLQFVTFMDAGAAWKGFLPSQENMSVTLNFPNMPANGLNNVRLSVDMPNGGFALGYGAGLRTALSGYFLRLDAAWNVDGSKKPIIYFALGTDF